MQWLLSLQSFSNLSFEESFLCLVIALTGETHLQLIASVQLKALMHQVANLIVTNEEPCLPLGVACMSAHLVSLSN